VEKPTARARTLKAAAPHTPILAIAGPRTDDEILHFAASGISAYVGPEITPEDLGETLVRIASGDLRCCHRIAAALMQASGALVADRATGSLHELTPREREVVQLVALAFSNKQIAERLYIQLPTVKTHVHNILGKLQLSRRGEIVTWADGRAATSSPV
jgi:DNA-binding NarL/FixJ family response regulator